MGSITSTAFPLGRGGLLEECESDGWSGADTMKGCCRGTVAEKQWRNDYSVYLYSLGSCDERGQPLMETNEL